MFKKLILLICFIQLLSIYPQAKTIHVFVSLCDNQFQGIVPVPKKLGNGKDPSNNLYWGAAYGVKSYFHRIAKDWKLVKKITSSNDDVLERVLFKHKYKSIFLLADAYDGEQIKSCTRNFLKASNHQSPEIVTYNKQKLSFGGDANLLAYIGHDGLMDFSLNIDYQKNIKKEKDVIILACYSQHFFLLK